MKRWRRGIRPVSLSLAIVLWLSQTTTALAAANYLRPSGAAQSSAADRMGAELLAPRIEAAGAAWDAMVSGPQTLIFTVNVGQFFGGYIPRLFDNSLRGHLGQLVTAGTIQEGWKWEAVGESLTLHVIYPGAERHAAIYANVLLPAIRASVLEALSSVSGTSPAAPAVASALVNPFLTKMQGRMRRAADAEHVSPELMARLIGTQAVHPGEVAVQTDGDTWYFPTVRSQDNNWLGPFQGGVRWLDGGGATAEAWGPLLPRIQAAAAGQGVFGEDAQRLVADVQKWMAQEARALSKGMTFKFGSLNLPHGGGKGTTALLGYQRDAAGHITRAQAWTIRNLEKLPAYRHVLRDVIVGIGADWTRQGIIGVGQDGPAGDVNTGEREMAWLTEGRLSVLAEQGIIDLHPTEAEQNEDFELVRGDRRVWLGKMPYTRAAIRQGLAAVRAGQALPAGFDQLGTFAGKPVEFGGLDVRTVATGLGGTYVFDAAVEIPSIRDRLYDPDRQELAVYGAGNAALFAAIENTKRGRRVVIINDTRGALMKADGFSLIDLQQIQAAKAKGQSVSNVEIDGASAIQGQQQGEQAVLGADVDALWLAGLENAVHKDNVGLIKAKIVVELANGPITEEADQQLFRRGVLVLHDSLASTGGTAVSSHERDRVTEIFQSMEDPELTGAQNATRRAARVALETSVRNQVQDAMQSAFREVWALAQAQGISLRDAGDRLTVRRLVAAAQAAEAGGAASAIAPEQLPGSAVGVARALLAATTPLTAAQIGAKLHNPRNPTAHISATTVERDIWVWNRFGALVGEAFVVKNAQERYEATEALRRVAEDFLPKVEPIDQLPKRASRESIDALGSQLYATLLFAYLDRGEEPRGQLELKPADRLVSLAHRASWLVDYIKEPEFHGPEGRGLKGKVRALRKIQARLDREFREGIQALEADRDGRTLMAILIAMRARVRQIAEDEGDFHGPSDGDTRFREYYGAAYDALGRAETPVFAVFRGFFGSHLPVTLEDGPGSAKGPLVETGLGQTTIESALQTLIDWNVIQRVPSGWTLTEPLMGIWGNPRATRQYNRLLEYIRTTARRVADGRGPAAAAIRARIAELVSDEPQPVARRQVPAGSASAVFEKMLEADEPFTQAQLAARVGRAVQTLDPDMTALIGWKLCWRKGKGATATFPVYAAARAHREPLLAYLAAVNRRWAKPTLWQRKFMYDRIDAILNYGDSNLDRTLHELWITADNEAGAPSPLTQIQMLRVAFPEVQWNESNTGSDSAIKAAIRGSGAAPAAERQQTPGSPAEVFRTLAGADRPLTKAEIAVSLGRAVKTIEPDLALLERWNLVQGIHTGTGRHHPKQYACAPAARDAQLNIQSVLNRLSHAKVSQIPAAELSLVHGRVKTLLKTASRDSREDAREIRAIIAGVAYANLVARYGNKAGEAADEICQRLGIARLEDVVDDTPLSELGIELRDAHKLADALYRAETLQPLVLRGENMEQWQFPTRTIRQMIAGLRMAVANARDLDSSPGAQNLVRQKLGLGVEEPAPTAARRFGPGAASVDDPAFGGSADDTWLADLLRANGITDEARITRLLEARRTLNAAMFRKYDIRGNAAIIDEAAAAKKGATLDLPPEAAFWIGWGYASLLDPGAIVTLGRDMRSTGPALADAFAEGATLAGVSIDYTDIISAGMMKWAYVHGQYVAKQRGGGHAVIVSGSHSEIAPALVHGFKFGKDGKPFVDQDIQLLLQTIQTGQFRLSALVRGVRTTPDITDGYINALRARTQQLLGGKTLSGLRIVYGSTPMVTRAEIPVALLREMGAEVVEFRMQRDLVDPSEPHTAHDLAEHIAALNRDLPAGERPWIALFNDPDADRIGLVDETGVVRSGDDILMLFVKDTFDRHPDEKRVVLDDRGSEERSMKLITALGGEVIRVPGGYSNVIPPMETNRAHLGAETTTHIMTDYVPEAPYVGIDDGLMNALHLAAIFATNEQLPGAMLTGLEQRADLAKMEKRELPLGVPDDVKWKAIEQVVATVAQQYESDPNVEISRIDGIKVHHQTEHWTFHVRVSNTGPKVTISVEVPQGQILLMHRIFQRVQWLVRDAAEALRTQGAVQFADTALGKVDLAHLPKIPPYDLVVEAFGGDAGAADADIAERLAAMQAVDPAATPEQATARLAWEYMPREIENVFPGDNFKFMLLAARAGMSAPILLLDLEDAVATTRKEIARDVLSQLIRLFRGEVLTQAEIDFLKDKALETNDKKPENALANCIEAVEGGFQLKAANRFHRDQMILIRPNNLRTKWAAGDYATVFRKIGHLIDGIYMPKVEDPQDVRITAAMLRAIQREQKWVEGRHKIFVLTELPGAVLTADRILAIAPEVEEAQLGVVDYTAATGGKNEVQLNQFPYMRHALLSLVDAATAAGKVAGTGITVKLEAEATKADTAVVTKLGIHRKWSVHPAHLTGMAPFIGRFPPVVRKRPAYQPLPEFDLKQLDQWAAENRPIRPPKVFVPKDVTLARSVVSVNGANHMALREALVSSADMVVIDIRYVEAEAFEILRSVLKGSERQGKIVALQLNPRDAGQVMNLDAFLRGGVKIDGVIVPKVTNASDVRTSDGLLSQMERRHNLPIGQIKLGVRIQTFDQGTRTGFEGFGDVVDPIVLEREAHAFEDQESQSILRCSRRLAWAFLDLPTEDFPVEANDDPTTRGYNYYHSLFIAMTAQSEIDAIDGASDADRLDEDTLHAANWGFVGKLTSAADAGRVNEWMSPQRAGEAPEKPTDADRKIAKDEKAQADAREQAQAKIRAWDAYVQRWKNSVERDLELMDLYAAADQDRNLGAVGFKDPVTGALEIVDAASARIPFRQLERAMKTNTLTDPERERYLKARERLLLAMRPGGREGAGTAVFAGQRFLAPAVVMRQWMVQGFAKTSGDRNRYHLDPAYAEQSRFKGLVAHGLLTVSTLLTSFSRVVPGYGIQTLDAQFKAPVRFDDAITPTFDVDEVMADGRAKIRMSAVNQEGKVVAEILATVQPRAPTDPIPTSADELAWVQAWVEDVTASFPSTIFDFTDPASPRTQRFNKPISEELMRATRALFGDVTPELLNQLLIIGTMAMTSAESSPGHLLMNAKVLEFGEPIQAGDVLTMTATVPDADKIKRTKPKTPGAVGDPLVPITIEITTRGGAMVAKASVFKIMEPQAPPAAPAAPAVPAAPPAPSAPPIVWTTETEPDMDPAIHRGLGEIATIGGLSPSTPLNIPATPSPIDVLRNGSYLAQVAALQATTGTPEGDQELLRGALATQFPHATDAVISRALAVRSADVSRVSYVVLHSDVLDHAEDAVAVIRRVQAQLRAVNRQGDQHGDSAIRVAICMKGAANVDQALLMLRDKLARLPQATAGRESFTYEYFNRAIPDSNDPAVIQEGLSFNEVGATVRIGSVIGPTEWVAKVKTGTTAAFVVDPPETATEATVASEAVLGAFEAAATSDGRLPPEVRARLTTLEETAGVLVADTISVEAETRPLVDQYRTSMRSTSEGV